MSPYPNKRCKHCGALLDEDAQFCEDCGQPVAEPAISPPQQPPFQGVPQPPVNLQYAPPPPLTQTNIPPAPAPQKSINTCLIAGIGLLVGVLCLSVAAVGGYFIYKQSNSPASVSIAPTTKPVLPPSNVLPATKPALPTANVLPTADAAPTAAPTSADAGIPDCPGAPPSRLHIGDDAEVVNVGGYSLVFRKEPRSDAAEAGSTPEGQPVIIREGPVCAENAYWWNMEFGEGGKAGWAWAPETGSDGGYLLEPVP